MGIRFLVASTSSNAGKTLVSSAFALHFKRKKKRVCVFKLGPDFLDVALFQNLEIHAENLDQWMMGNAFCANRLQWAYDEFDVIIVESNMGFFDGVYSAYTFASTFDFPVLLLANAKGVGETLVAQIKGVVNFKTFKLLGIVVNYTASMRHQSILEAAFKNEKLPYWGCIFIQDVCLEQQHLGLKPFVKFGVLKPLADAVSHFDTYFLPSVFPRQSLVCDSPKNACLTGTTVAVAQDVCLFFIYQANLNYLKNSGAKLVFFSVLTDAFPACDALYLPGGYPENFMPQILKNTAFVDGILQHHNNKKPIYAECGGALLLGSSVSFQNKIYSGLGILEARSTIHKKRQALGFYEFQTHHENIRGHSFHYGSSQYSDDTCYGEASSLVPEKKNEPIWVHNHIVSTYFHSFWMNCPRWVEFLFLKK